VANYLLEKMFDQMSNGCIAGGTLLHADVGLSEWPKYSMTGSPQAAKELRHEQHNLQPTPTVLLSSFERYSCSRQSMKRERKIPEKILSENNC
jgi:hypothetical protein